MTTEVRRRFSWEGFCQLDVAEAINEIGYSKTEIKRLFKSNAIKIWDTKITEDGNHFIRYKRVANSIELVEPDDVIIIGKYRGLTIKAVPFSFFEKAYYKLRLIKEQIQERLEDVIWSQMS